MLRYQERSGIQLNKAKEENETPTIFKGRERICFARQEPSRTGKIDLL